MRKAGLLIALFLILSTASFAQQKNGFSIFLSDPSVVSTSSSGTRWSSGIGASFDTMLTRRVSGQLSIAAERHRSYPYVVEDNGTITPVPARGLRTYPIDLAARYHFLNETRWKPYLGLGAHYVGAPNVDRRFRYQNHLIPEAVGGVVFMVKPSFGIMLDGKQLLGDREPYDPLFKASIGVSWRF